MKRKWPWFAGVSLVTVLLVSALTGVGQQQQAPPDSNVVIERRVLQGPVDSEGPPPLPPPPPGDSIMFVASEIGFDGQPVKGAPYSAEAVTESTQTLADGNRIVNKSTANVFRDGEGRTRREQTLRILGPFATSGEAPETILISDPIAGVSYTLDPRHHVARKMPAYQFGRKVYGPPAVKGEAHGAAMVIERAPLPPPAPGEPGAEGQVFTLKAPPGAGQVDFLYKREGGSDKNLVSEKLGTKVIEGVTAEGTRDTITIPAGEIGNERAIQIVNERWYSPELKTVVMTRHNDPRFGETVYRLTNISREEPTHALFEVPGDYTIKEMPRAFIQK